MTDQELDQLMRRVLLDAAAQNEGQAEPKQEFRASKQYQREKGNSSTGLLGGRFGVLL